MQRTHTSLTVFLATCALLVQLPAMAKSEGAKLIASTRSAATAIAVAAPGAKVGVVYHLSSGCLNALPMTFLEPPVQSPLTASAAAVFSEAGQAGGSDDWKFVLNHGDEFSTR